MIDEREVITKETVKKALLRDSKSEVLSCIMDTVFFGWMPMLILVFGICIIKSPRNGIEYMLNAFFYIAALILLAYILAVWYRAITTMHVVRKGEFEIAEDTLNTISEDEFFESDYFEKLRRRMYLGRSHPIEDAFYFSQYGRVHASKKVSAYSMRGDVFYLVIIPRKNDKVVKMYNSRIYRYEK